MNFGIKINNNGKLSKNCNAYKAYVQWKKPNTCPIKTNNFLRSLSIKQKKLLEFYVYFYKEKEAPTELKCINTASCSSLNNIKKKAKAPFFITQSKICGETIPAYVKSLFIIRNDNFVKFIEFIKLNSNNLNTLKKEYNDLIDKFVNHDIIYQGKLTEDYNIKILKYKINNNNTLYGGKKTKKQTPLQKLKLKHRNQLNNLKNKQKNDVLKLKSKHQKELKKLCT